MDEDSFERATGCETGFFGVDNLGGGRGEVVRGEGKGEGGRRKKKKERKGNLDIKSSTSLNRDIILSDTSTRLNFKGHFPHINSLDTFNKWDCKIESYKITAMTW